MDKVEVVLIDTEGLFRKGLGRLLSEGEDVEVLGETGRVDEAHHLIEKLAPNALVVGVEGTSREILGLLAEIHQLHPATSVIALTRNLQDQELLQLMKVGIAAQAMRTATLMELVSVIRRVSLGACPLAETLMDRPGVVSLILKEFRELKDVINASRGLLASLSPREVDVLTWVAEGPRGSQQGSGLPAVERCGLEDTLHSVLLKLARNQQALYIFARYREQIPVEEAAEAPAAELIEENALQELEPTLVP